ncbi:MAG: hypothetical protein EHM42_15440 [Planctomycetaceae bacterium]|nr:MAG: hypothetical protein EHM42_15440 [Planctomycetaceae bacterium]
MLGPEINQSNLTPVAKLVKSSRRQQANRVATARFFQGLLFPHRPVIVTAKEVAPVPDEQVETAKETLFRVRTALARGLKETERAYERYFEFDDVKVRALRALALLDAGLRINAESFGVDGDSRDEVIATLRRAIQSQNELGAQLERFESLQKKRLVTALSLVKTRGVAEKVLNAFQYGDTIAPVTKMGAALKQAMPALLELRNDFHGFHSLVVQDIDWKKYPPLVEQMVTKLTCACDHLRTIEYRLCDQEYPFDHARGRISLSKYLFEDSPGADKDDLKATAITAGEVLSRMSEFYFRQMEELAGIATEVEISLGHKPLPVPKKLADEPGFESSDF